MSYDSVVLGDTPVSYWELNESSGTTATDSADSNPGTYSGGFTLGQPGIGDGETAVALANASSGVVTVPAASNLQPTNVSAEVWVNATSTTSNVGFVGPKWPGSGGIGYCLGLSIDTGSGTAMMFGGYSGSAWTVARDSISFPTGAWTHCVGTYDGTNLRLYRNGVLVAGPTALASLTYQSQNLLIGQSPTAANMSDFVNGSMAKAAVYNYGLSATQVSNHYAAATALGPIYQPHRMPLGV